jgi:nicotinamidase-related amidase
MLASHVVVGGGARRLAALSLISLIAVVGCSGQAVTAPPKNENPVNNDDKNDDQDGDGDGDGDSPNDPPAGPGGTVTGPVGLVAIDVQRVFFDTATRRNPSADVPGRMAKVDKLFRLAGTKNVPIVVTFEDSKTGDHALPPSLATALPTNALQLIKTTFGAMGQPQFKSTLAASPAKRFVVIGAETDVCVMQTMLGMRRAGHYVVAVTDALITEEVNNGPALRRMKQAGIVQMGMADAEALIENQGASPAPSTTTPPVIIRPLEVGIVLNDVAGLTATDGSSAAKLARMRELLIISEWFKLPLLAANPEAALQAMPANLKTLITRPIVALANKPASVTQLVIAGGKAGLTDAVNAFKAEGKDVFLISDTLVGSTGADLEPLYANGAIPSTYKTLWYELTISVNDAEWPNQQWVTDGNAGFFNRTKAPEQLPPITTP